MRTVILRLACALPGLALLLWPTPTIGAPSAAVRDAPGFVLAVTRPTAPRPAPQTTPTSPE